VAAVVVRPAALRWSIDQLTTGRATRKHFHPHRVDTFTAVAECVETGVAQRQAKLIFAQWVERTMTLQASHVSRVLRLFSSVNFRMNFECAHWSPRRRDRHAGCQDLDWRSDSSQTAYAVDVSTSERFHAANPARNLHGHWNRGDQVACCICSTRNPFTNKFRGR